jgi:hypothetical protein
LCVYKKNANGGAAIGGSTPWVDAVVGCATENSDYIDEADKTGDWYLPNFYELATIYYKMANSKSATSQQTSFTSSTAQAAGITAIDGTQDMKTSYYYWSSTEHSNTTIANIFQFNNGDRGTPVKTNIQTFARCVRRL